MRHVLLLAAPLVLAAACGGAHPCLPRPAGSPVPANDPAVAHVDGERTVGGEQCLFDQSWTPRTAPLRGVFVLVHGLRDHSTRYDAFARALAARGYVVYAEDLRGHGRSGGDRQFIDSLEIYVDDVLAEIARARHEHPGLPVFVFGHSMGGAVVARLAIEHP